MSKSICFEPGQKITLPDGRKGKVEFVGLHFATVRIGKKLVTVKVGDLVDVRGADAVDFLDAIGVEIS